LDGCEEVIVAFVVSGCNGSEVFEFVKEPLDGIALFIEPWAEGGDIDTGWHGADTTPRSSSFEALSQTITVVSTVCQQYRPLNIKVAQINGRESS